MINRDDYQIKYEIFLAEQELNQNIIGLVSSINECHNLEIVNEGAKETIINYVTRITNSITGLWEKIKDLVETGSSAIYIKSLTKEKIQTVQPSFEIKNFPKYDFTKFEDLKVIPFNYEEMKDVLDSKEKFIERYYPNIPKGDGSLSERIESYILIGTEDIKCTKELIQELYNYVSSGYKKQKSGLETDLNTVNASNDNIKRLVDTIVTSTNETVNIIQTIYESYLTEEIKQNGSDSGDKKYDTKMTFVDNSNDPQEQGQEKKSNNNIVRHVTSYMAVSTEILTAKMRIKRNIYSQYVKTIRHYFGEEKESAKDNKTNQGQSDRSPNSIAKVKI